LGHPFLMFVLMLILTTTTTTIMAEEKHVVSCHVCHSDVDEECRSPLDGKLKDKFIVECDKYRETVYGSDDVGSLADVCEKARAAKGSKAWNVNENCNITTGSTPSTDATTEESSSSSSSSSTESSSSSSSTAPVVATNTTGNGTASFQKYGAFKRENGTGPLPPYTACRIIVSQVPKDLWIKGKEKATEHKGNAKTTVIRTCGWVDTQASKKMGKVTEGMPCSWKIKKNSGDSFTKYCTCKTKNCNTEGGKEALVPTMGLSVLLLLASASATNLWSIGF